MDKQELAAASSKCLFENFGSGCGDYFRGNENFGHGFSVVVTALVAAMVLVDTVVIMNQVMMVAV